MSFDVHGRRVPHGEITAFQVAHGLSWPAVSRMLRVGEVIVSADGSKLIARAQPAPSVPGPANPEERGAADDLTAQRAEIKHLVKTYIANAIAAGEPPAHALYGVVSDLRALAHDAGWSMP